MYNMDKVIVQVERGRRRTQHVNAALSSELFEALRNVSKIENDSVSGIVCKALLEYVRNRHKPVYDELANRLLK